MTIEIDEADRNAASTGNATALKELINAVHQDGLRGFWESNINRPSSVTADAN